MLVLLDLMRRAATRPRETRARSEYLPTEPEVPRTDLAAVISRFREDMPERPEWELLRRRNFSGE